MALQAEADGLQPQNNPGSLVPCCLSLPAQKILLGTLIAAGKERLHGVMLFYLCALICTQIPSLGKPYFQAFGEDRVILKSLCPVLMGLRTLYCWFTYARSYSAFHTGEEFVIAGLGARD